MKQSNTAQELLNMAKQLTDDSKKQIKKVREVKTEEKEATVTQVAIVK